MALQQKETEASFVCIVFALNIIDLPKELLVRFFRNVGDAVCCCRRRTFRGLYVCLFVEHTSELCEQIDMPFVGRLVLAQGNMC